VKHGDDGLSPGPDLRAIVLNVPFDGPLLPEWLITWFAGPLWNTAHEPLPHDHLLPGRCRGSGFRYFASGATISLFSLPFFFFFPIYSYRSYSCSYCRFLFSVISDAIREHRSNCIIARSVVSVLILLQLPSRTVSCSSFRWCCKFKTMFEQTRYHADTTIYLQKLELPNNANYFLAASFRRTATGSQAEVYEQVTIPGYILRSS